jgi:hypothetical protein
MEAQSGALDDVVTLESFAAAESVTHIGPSSGVSLNMILDEMVQATVWNKSLTDAAGNNPARPHAHASVARPVAVEELMSKRVKEPPTDELGSKLIRAYVTQLHSRYPFLNAQELWTLHRGRTTLASTRLDAMTREQRFGVFKLYLVYAIGATLLQLTERAPSSPEVRVANPFSCPIDAAELPIVTGSPELLHDSVATHFGGTRVTYHAKHRSHDAPGRISSPQYFKPRYMVYDRTGDANLH